MAGDPAPGRSCRRSPASWSPTRPWRRPACATAHPSTGPAALVLAREPAGRPVTSATTSRVARGGRGRRGDHRDRLLPVGGADADADVVDERGQCWQRRARFRALDAHGVAGAQVAGRPLDRACPLGGHRGELQRLGDELADARAPQAVVEADQRAADGSRAGAGPLQAERVGLRRADQGHDLDAHQLERGGAVHGAFCVAPSLRDLARRGAEHGQRGVGVRDDHSSGAPVASTSRSSAAARSVSPSACSSQARPSRHHRPDAVVTRQPDGVLDPERAASCRRAGCCVSSRTERGRQAMVVAGLWETRPRHGGHAPRLASGWRRAWRSSLPANPVRDFSSEHVTEPVQQLSSPTPEAVHPVTASDAEVSTFSTERRSDRGPEIGFFSRHRAAPGDRVPVSRARRSGTTRCCRL